MLESLWILLVPAADLAVQVPAVVVEGIGQSSDLLEAELPKIHESDDDIRQLYPRVVDVVLDLDGVSEGS